MTTVPNLVVGSSVEAWREWLADNSQAETEAWLVIQHKNSGVPGIRIHEAMEQALCFGWIDSLHRKHDADSSRLRFSPRRPRSTWSATNRERAARMIAAGLMTEQGQAMIDLAKERGTWEPEAEVTRPRSG